MKIEKLKPGMRVYEVQKRMMGNTLIRTVLVYEVVVEKVDIEKRIVYARWNHNPVKPYFYRSWSKWRIKPPKLEQGFCGSYRIKRRLEPMPADKLPANP